MHSPDQQRPDVDTHQQRLETLSNERGGASGGTAALRAAYVDRVNELQARLREMRERAGTLKDAKDDGWQSLERTANEHERKLHDTLAAIVRPEDLAAGRERVERQVTESLASLDAHDAENAPEITDVRKKLEAAADTFYAANRDVQRLHVTLRAAIGLLGKDAKDYQGQWFQDADSEGIIRQRIDRIGRLETQLKQAQGKLAGAVAEYVGGDVAVLKADAQAAFDRGETEIGNRTLLKIWERHGATMDIKKMDPALWARMGKAIGDLKADGKLSPFEEKFYGNDATYDDAMKVAVDEHRKLEGTVAQDVDIADQLKSGGSVKYERYAMPEKATRNVGLYGGYYAITTQNGERIEGVAFDNAALAIIEKNPKQVVFLKKPFNVEFTGVGAIKRGSYVGAEDLAYAELDGDGKKLTVTHPTTGKVLRTTDVGAVEKDRDERVSDVLRCVDRDPAMNKILGNASEINKGCHAVQELFAGGSGGGKYERFVEFSRNGANDLMKILDDPETLRNAQAVRAKLTELKKTELGIAHGGLEAELDARIKAIDGFVNAVKNPQLRAAIDTMRDKSKWSADTWANWMRKDGPQILAAIAIAVLATTTIILTCGGAAPLWAMAAAGTAGGMVGAEMMKEIQHATAQYDEDVVAGRATYTDRSKLGAYAEGQKTEGDGRERSFIDDVAGAYAKEFAVGFVTTLATMGAANAAGGTISRFLENPRVLAALARRGPTLNNIILRMQVLQRAEGEVAKKTTAEFAKKVAAEFGDELKDEAVENGTERFLDAVQKSLKQAEAGLGLGDAASFIVGTIQNIRPRKPGVMSYGVKTGVDSKAAITDLAANLQAQRFGVETDATNPNVLIATAANGETLRFEPEPDAPKQAEATDETMPLTEEEFLALKKNYPYEMARGTNKSADEKTFLYKKKCHAADSLEQVEANVAVLRTLTAQGMFHPDTKWNYYQAKDGTYQAFGIMPALNTTDDGDPKNQKALTMEQLSSELGRPATYNDWMAQNVEHPDSHIGEWIRRIEPGYDFQSEPKNPLVITINPFEASHGHNWGWDKETGRMYPLDVEVVSFEHESEQKAALDWNRAHRQREDVSDGGDTDLENASDWDTLLHDEPSDAPMPSEGTEPESVPIDPNFAFGPDLEQANVGNCYLVAAFNGMYHHPRFDDMMATSIRQRRDGSFEVSFPLGSAHPTETIVVTREDIGAQKTDDGRGELQPVTGFYGWSVLEAAYLKKKTGGMDRTKMEGGYGHEALGEMFGDTVKPEGGMLLGDLAGMRERGDLPADMTDDYVREQIHAGAGDFFDAFDPNATIATINTASTPSGKDTETFTVTDADGVEITLFKNHAYSIESVDRVAKTVVLKNPHDTSVAITLTYAQAIEAFSDVSAVRFSEH